MLLFGFNQNKNSQTMTLNDLPIAQEGFVAAYSDDQIGGKLMSMGVLPESKVAVKRKASYGNTFWIVVNNQQQLAIRKSEAACIILK